MSERASSLSTSTGNRRVCPNCIGEEYIEKVVNRFGKNETCFYCKSVSRTITVESLAKYIKRFFNDHYTRYMKESDFSEIHDFHEPDGNVKDIIMEYADLNITLLDDVQIELQNLSFDYEEYAVTMENPFDDTIHYYRRRIDCEYWDSLWNELEVTMANENRLFNTRAREVLKRIFSHILEINGGKMNSSPSIVEVGPNTSRSNLFRAREFQSDENLYHAFKYPDIELGPPPSSIAAEGRMNAKGISVFYGAMDIEVAISEIRPAVGSRVIVANFDIIRNLRLLDIEELQSTLVEESMFNPLQKRILEKKEFISKLSKHISAPAMPKFQSKHYLITQAVSDYLSDLRFPNSIDGIIYNSAQKGKKRANVVLFHKASYVELQKNPEVTDVSQHLEDPFNEDSEIVYDICEFVPNDDAKESKSTNDENERSRGNNDKRIPSLSLDRSNIHVRYIDNVYFNSREQVIERFLIRENEYYD